jgi:uncharacterized sulfatase
MGAALDLLPTIAAMTGAPLPERPLDGIDLAPALFRGAASPRDTFQFWRDHELYALRRGPWKAHFVTRGAYGRGPGRTVHDVPELYNLDEDPGERYDVAAKHPEVVRELTRLAEEIRASVTLAPPLIGLR